MTILIHSFSAPSKPLGVKVTPRRTNEHHGIAMQSFIVSWDEPSEKNGKIVSFRIRYRKLGSLWAKSRRSIEDYFVLKNFTGTPTDGDRKHIVDGLLPYTEYEVAVQELTVAWGPYSDPVKNTTKQGSK